MQKLNQIDFKFFPIILIIIYVPFHVMEEALFDFPRWMYEHYNLPSPLSYPHWLINNFVFFAVLIIGFSIYMKNRRKNISFGIGILIWALMNSFEHILFSILDMKISPGIITAILFSIISILGFIKLNSNNLLKASIILKSTIIAISYWIVSFAIIIISGLYLIKIFP